MKRMFVFWAVVIAFATVSPQIAAAQAAPSTYTSAIRYDSLGRVTGMISPDPDGAGALRFYAVRMTYNFQGLPTKIENGQLTDWQSEAVPPAGWPGFTVNKSTETVYDSYGRKTIERQVGSSGVVALLTQYSYDNFGRQECTASRMNPASWGNLPASACVQSGAPLSCTDATAINSAPDDRITRNVYDNAGQLIRVQKAYATCIQEDYSTYTYSANGKMSSMADARGYKASFVYDGFDRQAAWIFPSKAAAGVSAGCNIGAITEVSGVTGPSGAYVSTDDCEKYFYDSNGNRRKLMKRDGSLLAYSVDNLNRLTVKDVDSTNVRTTLPSTHKRDVYYAYDLRGLMTEVRFDSTVGEGITTGYDGFGRIISATQAFNGASRVLAYCYDRNGNRTRVAFPGASANGCVSGNWLGNVAYTYDGLDRPTKILRENSAAIASYTYNAAGQRTGLSGGISTIYAYDPVGRLTSLTNNLPASVYNNKWTFTYNPANQIVSQSRTNDQFAFTASVNVDRNYATNGLNQYTAAGSANFCYDANGNLTADGANVYLYDVENRLVEKRTQGVINSNCAALSFAGALQAALRYDSMGRLFEVTASNGTTTRFLNDGDALVAEYDAAGALLRRYVHGADAKADDPIAWYEGAAFTAANERRLRPDWESSIVLVSDSIGSTVLAINRFDEYGIPQSTNVGRFQYTGQAWIPELGMYYYKARIYSPTLGRFLQTDPIGYKDQVNLYAYVGNDPMNHVDPTGLRDVYIGGAYDKDATRLVQDYAQQQQVLNPGRDIQYFSWVDQKSINAAISAPLPKGEPLNVIGHSLGGSSGVIAANLTGAKITNLLTIDPVAQAGNGTKPSGVSFWGNVTASPKGWPNFSDTVAGTGRAALGTTATSGADSQATVDAHHGDFSKMMSQSGAGSIVSQSYTPPPPKTCARTGGNPC